MNNQENQKELNKRIYQAKSEILVNKNPAKAIKDISSLINSNIVKNDLDLKITKNILALAYLEDKKYKEASKTFYENEQFYQHGFCELLQGNIDLTKEIWEKLPDNSIVQWGKCLLGFISLDAYLIPSFLQIRNYLESDIAYFLKADKVSYAENVISYSDFLFSVHPESYKFIGKALINNNFPNVATNFYFKSRDEFPQDAEIYFLLAHHSIIKKARNEAKELLKTCINLNPHHYPAKKLLNQLESKHKFKFF